MTTGRSLNWSSRLLQSRIDELPTNSTPPAGCGCATSSAANAAKAASHCGGAARVAAAGSLAAAASNAAPARAKASSRCRKVMWSSGQGGRALVTWCAHWFRAVRTDWSTSHARAEHGRGLLSRGPARRPGGEHRAATLETVRRPVAPAVVVLAHRGRIGRQHDPRLLRRGENVNVGRKAIGVVERADAHELQRVACTRVMAPQRDVTVGTADDPLAAPAVRRRVDAHECTVQHFHPIRFDQRVERERGPCFALAPAAMAAMDEEGIRHHPVADVPAGAAAFERIAVVHVVDYPVAGSSASRGGPFSSTVLPSGSVMYIDGPSPSAPKRETVSPTTIPAVS